MLDSDLADLYEVETRYLNKAVKRKIKRFPNDFMFQLTNEEFKDLMFQIGTSKEGSGGCRKVPSVFTENGIAMLSVILNKDRNKIGFYYIPPLIVWRMDGGKFVYIRHVDSGGYVADNKSKEHKNVL